MRSSRARFYRHFNACLLHMLPLGLVKLHVTLFSDVFEVEFATGILLYFIFLNVPFYSKNILVVNARAISISRFPGQLSLSKGIYREVNTGTRRFAPRPFTADEWDTVVEVSLYLFHEYAFLKFIININYSYLPVFSLLSEKHMAAWVLRVQNYYRLKYTPFHRDAHEEWFKECNKVEAMFVSAFESETNDKTGLPASSFLQVNHHTHAFHWVFTILFNGTPTHQSTQRWERFHQPVKHFGSQSNGKNIFLSIMQSVC